MYACVAVLAHTHGHQRDSSFQLGALLQTMKQAWRAHLRRHDVKGADGCLLVELLPKDAQQIPPTLRDRLQLEQLPEDKMPVSFAHLAAFAPRVRLRQTRPAEPREQAWVPQLAHLLNQLQSRSDGGLHNLQIFTPAQTKCPQPQLALTNEAAEPPQTQLAPADAPAARGGSTVLGRPPWLVTVSKTYIYLDDLDRRLYLTYMSLISHLRKST